MEPQYFHDHGLDMVESQVCLICLLHMYYGSLIIMRIMLSNWLVVLSNISCDHTLYFLLSLNRPYFLLDTDWVSPLQPPQIYMDSQNDTGAKIEIALLVNRCTFQFTQILSTFQWSHLSFSKCPCIILKTRSEWKQSHAFCVNPR